jgi:hypothetical protein
MLETVLKTILNENEVDIESDDIPQLLRKVQKEFSLLPSEIDKSSKGAEIIKRTLSNLGQIVVGVGELRNLYGTGHGRVKNQTGIEPYHARLVANSGVTLAKFLMELHEENKK